MDYQDLIMQRQRRPLGTSLARVGAILAGKDPSIADKEETSGLDQLIKLNQLQTGTPEFKMQEAQTRANMNVQQALDIEDAKRNMAQEAYRKAVAARGMKDGDITPNGIMKYDEKIGDFVEQPLPPSIEARKIKATDDLYSTVKTANTNYDRINKGLEAAPKLPQGLFGSWRIKAMRAFDTNNPTLADWQNMKSLLTDAQLKKTAQTKGAISDKEMELFAKAVANDDLASVQRQTNILNSFKQAVFDDQEAIVSGFNRNFHEDPRKWEDLGYQNPYANAKTQEPSFLPQQKLSDDEAYKRYLASKKGK